MGSEGSGHVEETALRYRTGAGYAMVRCDADGADDCTPLPPGSREGMGREDDPPRVSFSPHPKSEAGTDTNSNPTRLTVPRERSAERVSDSDSVKMKAHEGLFLYPSTGSCIPIDAVGIIKVWITLLHSSIFVLRSTENRFLQAKLSFFRAKKRISR